MRILLPPSEGKTPAANGPALHLPDLSFPVLNQTREQVLEALLDLCRSDPESARSALGLGPSLTGEVQRNAALRDQPCGPAWSIYSGVVYGALDPGSLPGAAGRRLLIASALFGLLAAGDPIPAYRLPGSARLTGLPPLKRLWGPALQQLVANLADEHLLVDLRSSPYNGWGAAQHRRVVPVRIVAARGDRRVAAGHHGKAAKGLLARSLATAPQEPSDAEDLMDLLRALRWQAEPSSHGVDVLHPTVAA